MKIVTSILGIILLIWLAGFLQSTTFDECMSAGIQSKETCQLYAYK